VTRRSIAVVLAFLLVTSAGALAAGAVTAPSAGDLHASVERLTAPDMAGRRAGTPGGDRAAEQIATWLAGAGLRPGGDAGSFLQSFVIDSTPRAGGASVLEVAAARPRALELGVEWMPHGGSRAAEVAGRVAFVGYGVSAPERGWDDYAGLDVRDTVAVALEGGPERLAGTGTGRLEKLIDARHHGARALLIVGDSLPALASTSARVDLVSGAITRVGADVLLAGSGRTLKDLAAALVDRSAPASFVSPAQAHVRVELESEDHRTANVVGVLPGTDPALAGEAIVLGAHYDHLGEARGSVYPGADDNASGTAVVVGLARAFATAGGVPRTLVFALFGGEELGLLGSRHYVDRPAVPIERTTAMLNFDMVGRLGDGKLHIGGVDSAGGLRDLVRDAARAESLPAELGASPFTPSDHTQFYRAGAPVLFFHTGGHADYHRPTDTVDKIDASGIARVAAVASRIVQGLAAGTRPVYAKLAPPTHERRGPPSGSVFFGIAADGRVDADGLRLAAVVPGSAAARAGLRDGDVIVRFAEVTVNSFDDLRAALGRRSPGDTVNVVYLRDGSDHATAATLDARP
jgi:peptidase M28-like protein/PDZ domain-containing protein